MSGENAEGVARQPIAVSAHTHRHLEERLGLRFPRLVPPFAWAVWRLPPRSRLRQALIRRFVRLCFEAINRRDFEAALLLYHPQGESSFPAEFAGLGGESGTVGHEERLRFQKRWQDEWGEFRIEPQELIDAGDRLIVFIRGETTGLSSGAATTTEGAFVFTMSGGRAIHEQAFIDRHQALEAAGLSE
jgi:uncharacterized protein